MGWNSGSRLFKELILSLNEAEVDENQREMIYTRMIEVFTDDDWDTPDECLDLDKVYDRVLKDIRPEVFEDYKDYEEND